MQPGDEEGPADAREIGPTGNQGVYVGGGGYYIMDVRAAVWVCKLFVERMLDSYLWDRQNFIHFEKFSGQSVDKSG